MTSARNETSKLALICRGIAGLMLMAALLGGCVVGQKIPYGTTVPQVQSRGSSGVVLAVQDQRPEIVNGTKQPSFCGLLRGGYGNPFDLTTESGKPLAADFTDAIGRGLAAAGYRVAAMPTSPRQGDQEIMGGLGAYRSERAIWIQISAWRSDTYVNTALTYDVTARVLDAQGLVIGQTRITGRDELGGSAWNPAKFVKRAVPEATRRVLQRLFADPSIRAGLEGPPPLPVAGVPGPVAAPPQ